MAKKKSKAQSKKKVNQQKNTTKITPKNQKKVQIQKKAPQKQTKPKEENINNIEIGPIELVKIKEKKQINKYQKTYNNKSKQQNKKTPNKNLTTNVKEPETNNNIKLETEQKSLSNEKNIPKIKYITLKEYIYRKILDYKRSKNIDPKTIKLQEKEKRRQQYIEKLILNKNLEKEVQKVEKDYSNYNVIIRTLVKIYRNAHIIFNSILIASFLILWFASTKVGVYDTSSIIYFGSLLLFLIIVAITQNKFLSGKIFSIILVIGMGFVTSKIQYTYDFMNIINTRKYEYKEYYVVAIDNSQNRTIHNINNKKVGVLKETKTKTTRVLNTKIKKVQYLEYENNNELFDAFYNQNIRAMIVTENQYKYLKNNPRNNKEIKILHEFKAVTKKTTDKKE